MSKKTSVFADLVHYPIVVTDIEKRIISTSLFNRLHHVRQDSTAYLTYPSATHTRFSHSLGVMHIATELFFNGIANADDDVLDGFIKDFRNEINAKAKDEAFINSVRERTGKDDKTVREKFYLLDSSSQENVFSIYIPNLRPLRSKPSTADVINNKQTNDEFNDVDVLKFALQTLRILALLHDIGHPPYSHMVEYSFTEIYNRVSSKNPEKREKSEIDFYVNLHRFFEDSNPQKKSKSKNYIPPKIPPFHEQLGRDLLQKILSLTTLGYESQQLVSRDVETLAYLVNRCYQPPEALKSYPSLMALSLLIEDSFGADRLDYVVRDLSMSGVSRGYIRYNRLFRNYQLIQENKPKSYSFLPTIRALSTLEEFHNMRHDLYKYVLFHHRVCKTDALLQECVIRLIDNYFENESAEKGEDQTKDGHDDDSNNYLPNRVDALWIPFKQGYFEGTISKVLQWDDNLLMSILRKEFYTLEQKENNSNQHAPLFLMLEELLTGKKHYFSLYKRLEEYIEMESAFIKHLAGLFTKKYISVIDLQLATECILGEGLFSDTRNRTWKAIQPKWNEFKNIDLKISASDSEINNLITRYKTSIKDGINAIEDQESKNVLSEIVDLIDIYNLNVLNTARKKPKGAIERCINLTGLFLTSRDGKIENVSKWPPVPAFISNAINKWKKEMKVYDALIIRKDSKSLKTKRDQKIIGASGHVISFDQVSSIPESLEKRALDMPAFFIYFHKESASRVHSVELKSYRKRFGQILAEEIFHQLVKSEAVKSG